MAPCLWCSPGSGISCLGVPPRGQQARQRGARSLGRTLQDRSIREHLLKRRDAPSPGRTPSGPAGNAHSLQPGTPSRPHHQCRSIKAPLPDIVEGTDARAANTSENKRRSAKFLIVAACNPVPPPRSPVLRSSTARWTVSRELLLHCLMTRHRTQSSRSALLRRVPSARRPCAASRVLELGALLAITVLAAGVYILGGADALSAVTTSGGGLFITWRTRR